MVRGSGETSRVSRRSKTAFAPRLLLTTRAAYGAAVWSLLYGVLGLWWAFGGSGFPFGENDPGAAYSIFVGLQSDVGAPVIAGLGLIGALVALAMALGKRGGVFRAALLVCGWIFAATLALIVPDYRVLMGVAYTPIIVIGTPFDWPPGVGLADAFPWPVVNQLICIVGGLLWATATVIYGRRTRGACVGCGRRTGDASGWMSLRSASRWGRWATGVAVVVPVLYAATRWAWALGIPLGISQEFLREGQETGLWWAGAALATLGMGGAVLTLGLAQRWGEVFPRWIPFLSGGRVPVWLAVVPASLVAIIVTEAGLMFVRLALFSSFQLGERTLILDENWAAIAPELVWPLWGVALGAATLAYYYRRRGRCQTCGLGH